MSIKENFNCDFSNPEFLRMIHSFEVLVEYSILLVNKKKFKETFTFFNFILENYFPVGNVSLDKIDYGKLFVGKFAVQTRNVYKQLIELWMKLQNSWSLSDEDLPSLKVVIDKLNILAIK